MKKSIFLFFAAILCAMTANAYNQSAKDLYFDNSEAKWEKCYVYIGHSSWTSCYDMTRVAGTQYLWKLPSNFNGGSSWNSATGWVVCKEKWWASNGESIDKYVWHGDKNVTKKSTSAWVDTKIYKTNGTGNVTSDGTTKNVYNVTSYTKADYAVTINTVEGGTLTVKDYDNNVVTSGASKIHLTVLKFSAAPADGYVLDAVEINDGSTTTTIAAADLASKTYTLTSAVTITPVWHATTSTVTVTATATNGTVAGDGVVEKGATVTLTATPADGYKFINWTVGGAEVSTANPYTFTAEADVTVVANFEELPKATIYFINNGGWSNVNVYAWEGAKGANPAWPGAEITANKLAEKIAEYDVYSYTVEQGSYGKVIFNNGSGAQTQDYVWTDGNYYWHNEALNFAGGTKAQAEEKLSLPVEYDYVYLINTNDWAKANIYTWTPEVAGWPGAAMTKEAEQIAGKDVYSYKVVKGTTFGGLLFNNGDGKTGDLTWQAGKYYAPSTNEWYADAAAAEAALATPAPTYDYYVVGTFNSWNEKDPNHGMTLDGEVYKATVTLATGANELKVTNGTWDNAKGINDLAAEYVEVSAPVEGDNIVITLAEGKDIVVVYNATTGKVTFEGLTEKLPAVITYVLMGVNGDWTTGIPLVRNEENTEFEEYMLLGQEILDGDAVKVVTLTDGVATAWCGDVDVQSIELLGVTFDENGNVVLAPGKYDFYYKKADDGMYIAGEPYYYDEMMLTNLVSEAADGFELLRASDNMSGLSVTLGVYPDGSLHAGSNITVQDSELPIVSSSKATKEYSDELESYVYTIRILVDFGGERMGMELVLMSIPVPSIDVVLEQTILSLENGALVMSGTWVKDEVEYPFTATIGGFDYTVAEAELIVSVELGDFYAEDETLWLGYGEGRMLVTVEDGVITLSGSVTTNNPQNELNITAKGYVQILSMNIDATIKELNMGDAVYLHLTGTDYGSGIDVDLYLNDYTGENKTYELNEASSIASGAAQATGSLTKAGSTYTGVVYASAMGTLYVLELNLTEFVPEYTDIVITDATVTEEVRSLGWGDATYTVLELESTWSDGVETYPVLVEVNDYDLSVSEGTMAVSVTIGDNETYEPWLGWAEGEMAYTIVDGVITLTGKLDNPEAWPAPVYWNLTITGTLPAVAEPVEIVGVVKRAIQNGDAVIVLTHEADGAAHIYNVVDEEITEISQEGVVAVDPENAGDLLAISDIALTEDGKLVAVNKIVCQSDAGQVKTGYKRGELKAYIWNDLAGAPSIWFTSKMSSNWYNSIQGHTMAVKGTSTDATIMATGMNLTSPGKSRYSVFSVKDGVYVEPAVNDGTHYHFTKGTNITLQTLGENYELNVSPLAENTWVLDGNLIDPFEITDPLTYNTEVAVGITLTEDLGEKYNGTSYVTVGAQVLMVAPYAAEDNLAGVKVLDITAGLDAATVVTTVDLDAAVEATAAATAVEVVEDELVITLVADATIHTLVADIYQEPGTGTALENIAVEGKAVKAIINGQLVIIKNGVQYNAQGQLIK